MDAKLLPTGEEARSASPSSVEEMSLATSLRLIEVEILKYLELRRTTTLRELIRQLEWPSRLIMMAIGALVHERQVRAIQHELEVSIETVDGASLSRCGEADAVPEVWGRIRGAQ